MFKMINRIIAITLVLALVLEQSGFAQVAPQMPMPAYINGYVAPDRFRPVQLRSLRFDEVKHDFNLVLDKGDARKLKPQEVKLATDELMKFFTIGLALPNTSFWVNLRPDSADQVIDPYLAQTDAGRILLAADLQLKKDMARFTSPKTSEGRNYWNKLYGKAEELFGAQQVSIPTITRPWIVPGEILVRENQTSAYIFKASLKVMLEQDWIVGTHYQFDDPRLKQLNEYSSAIIREEILPKLTREVNSSRKYAGLRQVYYALILAQWFKQRYGARPGCGQKQPEGAQGYVSRIDSRNLEDMTSHKAWSKEQYYREYKKSFEQGEYNLSETVSTGRGMVVRQYFSGGVSLRAGQSALPAIGQANPASASAGEVAILKDNLIEVSRDGSVLKEVAGAEEIPDGGKAKPTMDDLKAQVKTLSRLYYLYPLVYFVLPVAMVVSMLAVPSLATTKIFTDLLMATILGVYPGMFYLLSSILHAPELVGGLNAYTDTAGDFYSRSRGKSNFYWSKNWMVAIGMIIGGLVIPIGGIFGVLFTHRLEIGLAAAAFFAWLPAIFTYQLGKTNATAEQVLGPESADGGEKAGEASLYDRWAVALWDWGLAKVRGGEQAGAREYLRLRQVAAQIKMQPAFKRTAITPYLELMPERLYISGSQTDDDGLPVIHRGGDILAVEVEPQDIAQRISEVSAMELRDAIEVLRVMGEVEPEPMGDGLASFSGNDGGDDATLAEEIKLAEVNIREDAIRAANALRGLAIRAKKIQYSNEGTSVADRALDALYKAVRADLLVVPFRHGTIVWYRTQGKKTLVISTFRKFRKTAATESEPVQKEYVIPFQIRYDGEWRIYLEEGTDNLILKSPAGTFLLSSPTSKYRVTVKFLAPPEKKSGGQDGEVNDGGALKAPSITITSETRKRWNALTDELERLFILLQSKASREFDVAGQIDQAAQGARSYLVAKKYTDQELSEYVAFAHKRQDQAKYSIPALIGLGVLGLAGFVMFIAHPLSLVAAVGAAAAFGLAAYVRWQKEVFGHAQSIATLILDKGGIYPDPAWKNYSNDAFSQAMVISAVKEIKRAMNEAGVKDIVELAEKFAREKDGWIVDEPDEGTIDGGKNTARWQQILIKEKERLADMEVQRMRGGVRDDGLARRMKLSKAKIRSLEHKLFRRQNEPVASEPGGLGYAGTAISGDGGARAKKIKDTYTLAMQTRNPDEYSRLCVSLMEMVREDVREYAGKKRILVVDDERSMRELISIMYHSLGFAEIETASNPVEALEKYREAIEQGRAFDLVSTDHSMPFSAAHLEKDGLWLAGQIQQMNKEKGIDIPIVWTSGADPEESGAKAARFNGTITAVVGKPRMEAGIPMVVRDLAAAAGMVAEERVARGAKIITGIRSAISAGANRIAGEEKRAASDLSNLSKTVEKVFAAVEQSRNGMPHMYLPLVESALVPLLAQKIGAQISDKKILVVIDEVNWQRGIRELLVGIGVKPENVFVAGDAYTAFGLYQAVAQERGGIDIVISDNDFPMGGTWKQFERFGIDRNEAEFTRQMREDEFWEKTEELMPKLIRENGSWFALQIDKLDRLNNRKQRPLKLLVAAGPNEAEVQEAKTTGLVDEVVSMACYELDLCKALAAVDWQKHAGQAGVQGNDGGLKTAAVEAQQAEASQVQDAAQAPSDLGGIDMRALPVQALPAVAPIDAAAAGALAGLSLAQLDQRWEDIRKTMAKGELPFREMKELLTACAGRQDALKQKKQVVDCVSAILEMEEERAIATPAELKELVALL